MIHYKIYEDKNKNFNKVFASLILLWGDCQIKTENVRKIQNRLTKAHDVSWSSLY
jgi:hypothetical protein